MDFGEATSIVPLGDGRFAWDVPEGWLQGRGAWGGLVAGGVLRAVTLTEPDPERRLRTVSIHMSGPLPAGAASVRVEPLRLGSGMSTWSVLVEDAAGDLCTHAVVLTGRARVPDLAEAGASWGTTTMPDLPGWEGLDPIPMHTLGGPGFMEQLELRLVEGIPMSGGPARVHGYVRFAEQGPWDAVSLLSIVDAWYPTVFPVLTALRPLATVTYAAHLLLDPATLPPGVPLAYEAFLSAAHEGFTTETRRLWAPDGRLAVENHQAITVIR